jgi:hypothetical protein
MATKGYSLDDAPVGGGREKAPRVDELVDLVELNAKFTTVRIVGDLYAYGIHWVKTKRRDGSLTQFPVGCSAFDPDTGQRDSTKECPWCSHMAEHPEPKDANARKGHIGVSFAVDYYTNVIMRSLQKKITTPEEPSRTEAKSGFKDKESDTPTIFRVLRLTAGTIRTIRGLRDLNVHEGEDGESNAYPVSHPKYGADIALKYDDDAAGAAKYPVQLGQQSPLKKSEKGFLQWDISNLISVPDLKTQESEYAAWAERMGFGKKKKKPVQADDEDDDTGSGLDDDEDEAPKAKTKKKPTRNYDEDDEEELPKAKSKKKPVVDEEEDDEELPKAKSKKKPVVEDDDEEEVPKPTKKKVPAFDDEEDDEEEKPKAKVKKKPVVDEDDDEEEKPKAKAKKKPVIEDDDDEEVPPPKSKAKKKPVVDEDDDDIPY